MGLKPSKNGRLPVIEPVGNQTFRIELPLPLPDLKVVNAYVINGADGLTLIDPGWSTPESESALVGALHTIDCGISDIRRILVTHAHGDHYTQAAKWRDELGAELMLGS